MGRDIDELCKKADKHIKILNKTFSEMKRKNITICNKCGCEIHKDKEHKCRENKDTQ